LRLNDSSHNVDRSKRLISNVSVILLRTLPETTFAHRVTGGEGGIIVKCKGATRTSSGFLNTFNEDDRNARDERRTQETFSFVPNGTKHRFRPCRQTKVGEWLGDNAVLFCFSSKPGGGGEIIVLKIESDINIPHCRTYYKTSF